MSENPFSSPFHRDLCKLRFIRLFVHFSKKCSVRIVEETFVLIKYMGVSICVSLKKKCFLSPYAFPNGEGVYRSHIHTTSQIRS